MKHPAGSLRSMNRIGRQFYSAIYFRVMKS